MNRLPVFLEDNLILRCPHCDGIYLHQRKVQTFFRSEDEDQTKVSLHSFDEDITTVMTNDLSLNPSYRRHGLRISFTCENCTTPEGHSLPDIGDLCIYQHKGQTFVEWDTNENIIS
jgi:hypothetical protein